MGVRLVAGQTRLEDHHAIITASLVFAPVALNLPRALIEWITTLSSTREGDHQRARLR